MAISLLRQEDKIRLTNHPMIPPPFQAAPVTKKLSSGWKFAWLLPLFLLVLLSQSPYLEVPLTQNEGLASCVAQEMEAGAKLYSDVWDHKPPLLFLQYLFLRAWLGRGPAAVHLYTLCVHLLNTLLIFWLARRLELGFFSACLCGLVYSVCISSPLFQPWAGNADVLMLPALLASWCMASDQSVGTVTLAGALWALSFLTKQSALFFLPVFLPLFVPRLLNKLAFFGAGAAATLFFFVCPFLFTGRGGLLYQALLGFHGLYLQKGWATFSGNPDFQREVLSWIVGAGGHYGLLVLVSLGGGFWGLRAAAKRRVATFVILALGGGLLSCVASGFFFRYYFVVLLPVLALGAGLAYEEGKLFLPRWALGLFFGASVLPLLAQAGAPWQQSPSEILIDWDHTDREVKADELGTYLSQRHQLGERVLAWANEPQIYSVSGLRMAALRTPFVNAGFFIPGELERVGKKFAQNPPRYVVLSQSKQVGPVPTWLQAGLKAEYQLVGTSGGQEPYLLFERRVSGRGRAS